MAPTYDIEAAAREAAARSAASRVAKGEHSDTEVEAVLIRVLRDGYERSRGTSFVLDSNEVVSAASTGLGHEGWAWAGPDFDAQVQRALKRLARRGAVVKVKRGDEYMTATGPRRNGGQWSLWMHPATFERLRTEGDGYVRRADRAAHARDERVAKMRDWAEIQGLDVEFPENTPNHARVDLDTLEAILVRLAREEQ